MAYIRAGKYHLCWALVLSVYAVAASGLGVMTGLWLLRGDELVADLPVMRQWWLPVVALVSGVYVGKEARECWMQWWVIVRFEARKMRVGYDLELPYVVLDVKLREHEEVDVYSSVGELLMYGPSEIYVSSLGISDVEDELVSVESLVDGLDVLLQSYYLELKQEASDADDSVGVEGDGDGRGRGDSEALG